MTQSATIRAYLKAHPNASVPDVALALSIPERKAGYCLRRLAREGLATRTGEGKQARYSFLRDRTNQREVAVLPPPPRVVTVISTPESRSPSGYAAFAAETYEQFLARGGRPEILPGFQYVPCASVPMRGRWRGAGSAG